MSLDYFNYGQQGETIMTAQNKHQEQGMFNRLNGVSENMCIVTLKFYGQIR
jgi:hypothetical protein